MGLEFHLKGNVISHEAVVDLDKLKEFEVKHNSHMEKKSADPSGQGYIVTYFPCGIGTSVKVKCRCGETADLTDYSVW
jgi:hypothetical protein